MNIVRYEHHNTVVAVREDLKGRHREHCLCYSCKSFTPDERDQSCPIANMLYAACVAFSIVTPVWECPYFSNKEA